MVSIQEKLQRPEKIAQLDKTEVYSKKFTNIKTALYSNSPMKRAQPQDALSAFAIRQIPTSILT